jgi:UPF0755 protein
MKRIAIALGVLGLLGLGAAGAGYFWVERAVNTPAAAQAEEVEFTVPKGTSARGLGPLLQKQGLITDARLWRYHLWRNDGLSPRAGRFKLRASQSIPELATALSGSPLPEDQPVTFVEGWRLRDTDAALVARGLISPGDWIRAASQPHRFKAAFPLPSDTLEGYLYPETYGVVLERFDVDALIQAQLDTFGRRFYEPHKDEISRSGRTLHQLVIMASLLEREEPVPAQRPLVAGILWKRFDNRVALGVDATSRYELAEWNDRKAFLKKLRDRDDIYNTRTKVGLPPTPIGAPSVSSLEAALRPTPSEFWYYLHDSEKRLHPSRNAAEHEALRAKYNVY